MALFDTTWYVNFGDGATTGYYAVAKRPQNAAVAAGQIVRQFTAPSVGSERCYICLVAGTTANTTDATWSTGRTTTTDGTVTWIECTGASAVNGDFTNTPTWAMAKASGTSVSQGAIIRRNNGASYHVCRTSGTPGASEPAFSDTAGATLSDNGLIWYCLGPVSNFTGGQAPHARLANALATNWFASGNTVYVGDNHAETQSTAMTLSPSSALLAKILCHNRSGSYPPAASDITTGAQIITTSFGQISFTGQGSFYFYGIAFVSYGTSVIGAASVGQTQNWYYFDNCSWQWGAGASIAAQLGASSTAWGTIVFNNTPVKIAATAMGLATYFCRFVWQNTGQILVAGSTVPVNLFQQNISSGRFNEIILRNLDLSQLTGSLFTNATNSSIGSLVVQDCKLNAAMTVTRPINTGMQVQLIRSDSAATAYKSTRVAYEGTEDTEVSIVRTDGAVDPTGVAQSRKIVTTANAQWLRPFKAEPMAIYNGAVGSPVTVTVCGIANAGALPNNDDIWLECEYLGNASSVASATFDGVKSANIALSNGNRTATNSDGTSNTGARSTAFKTTGKYYFEVTRLPGGTTGLGIMTEAATYANLVTDGTNCTVALSAWIYSNNVNTTKTAGAGAIVSVAVDLTARKAWFRADGGSWNGEAIGLQDPATGTGGVTIQSSVAFAPAVGFGAFTSGYVLAGNFGQTAYSYTPPSGFGNWIFDVPASPLGTIVTTTKSSVLASNAAVASDSSGWATPTTTYDGANTLVAMSNGNRTVTHNNTTNNAGAMSTAMLSAGKYYFEVKTEGTVSGQNYVGIISSLAGGTFTTANVISFSTTIVFTPGSSLCTNGASTAVDFGSVVAGDICCFAIDLTARQAWIRRNGGLWNMDAGANPATGVGGVIIGAGDFAPIVRFGTATASTDAQTGNFGQAAYAFTPPSGFLNWNTGWKAFKLETSITPQLPGYIHARMRAAKISTTYYIDPKIVLS